MLLVQAFPSALQSDLKKFLEDKVSYNPNFIEKESGSQTGQITAANQLAVEICSSRGGIFLNSCLLSVCGQRQIQLYSSKNEVSRQCSASGSQ